MTDACPTVTRAIEIYREWELGVDFNGGYYANEGNVERLVRDILSLSSLISDPGSRDHAPDVAACRITIRGIADALTGAAQSIELAHEALELCRDALRLTATAADAAKVRSAVSAFKSLADAARREIGS